jgi:hypothetical protein
VTWYDPNQYLPTQPPARFIWCCDPGGGSGHTQVFEIPGQYQFIASLQPGTAKNTCGITPAYTIPSNMGNEVVVYREAIGSGWGAWRPIPGVQVTPGTGGLEWTFPGITTIVEGGGLDSVQISGLRIAGSCSSGSQYMRTSVKKMRMDIVWVPETTMVRKKDEILLRHATDTYQPLQATGILYPTGNTHLGTYVAYADVTDYVNEYGGGDYWVANMALQMGPSGDPGLFGGWGMVVVYENEKMNSRSIAVYDGYSSLRSATNTVLSQTVALGGFKTPPLGDVNGKIGVMSGGGTRAATQDRFQVAHAS